MHYSQALERLKQGNRRFVSGIRSVEAIAPSEDKRRELAESGQRPFAMILSCADSRVPAEMIFDCGMGDLFVVRVAGNIVAPSLIGSLEFAAENFGTSLCIVMGHSQCGAIASSVKAVREDSRPESDNIQQIVLEIGPSVRKALEHPGPKTEDFIVSKCTEENVRHSVESLRQRSRVLSRLADSGKLLIAGAVYNLRSGKVQFLETAATQTRTAEGARAGLMSQHFANPVRIR